MRMNPNIMLMSFSLQGYCGNAVDGSLLVSMIPQVGIVLAVLFSGCLRLLHFSNLWLAD